MCIKSAPYLHPKKANWSLNIILFCMLMSSLNSSQIALLEGAVPANLLLIFFLILSVSLCMSLSIYYFSVSFSDFLFNLFDFIPFSLSLTLYVIFPSFGQFLLFTFCLSSFLLFSLILFLYFSFSLSPSPFSSSLLPSSFVV